VLEVELIRAHASRMRRCASASAASARGSHGLTVTWTWS
jgi:hypothetical protein